MNSHASTTHLHFYHKMWWTTCVWQMLNAKQRFDFHQPKKTHIQLKATAIQHCFQVWNKYGKFMSKLFAYLRKSVECPGIMSTIIGHNGNGRFRQMFMLCKTHFPWLSAFQALYVFSSLFSLVVCLFAVVIAVVVVWTAWCCFWYSGEKNVTYPNNAYCKKKC